MNVEFAEESRYNPPSKEFLENGRAKFKSQLGLFCARYNMPTNDFKINIKSVDKLYTRLHQRLSYYLFFHGKDLAQSRQAGIIAYWILRYRPLLLIAQSSWSKSYDINVYLAFFILFSEVLGEHLAGQPKDVQRAVVNNIIASYESEFIRAFSEYDISKEAMMLLSEGMKSICKGELKSYT